ncbi:MAG TPA: hypothetical protein VGF40_04035 [Thermoanaerobaculia bacterium]
MKTFVQKYPKTARVMKEIALYAAIFGGVFVLYAYVLPLVGFET